MTEDATTCGIITAPKVYLVGGTTVGADELDRFLGDSGIACWTTDTEVGGQKLIEVAGRLCYWSFAKPRPGGNAAYIGHILDVGHGSVLEHSVFNLVITGVSRSFTHELVRHRAGFGFSQLSQRFHDESEAAFVLPPALEREMAAYLHRKDNDHVEDLRFDEDEGYEFALQKVQAEGRRDGWDQIPVQEFHAMADAAELWVNTVQQCQSAYAALAGYLDGKYASIPDRTARRKKAREAARSVLPNATETKIFVTANARALRHFVEMRADPAADAEIRAVALAVLSLLQADSPNLFGDYEVVDAPDGTRSATTPHRKV